LPENSKDKNSKFAISTKISRDSGPIDYDDLSKAFIIKKLNNRGEYFLALASSLTGPFEELSWLEIL
jgi:hypothetical protein